jgi:flagellar hook protein FlgE
MGLTSTLFTGLSGLETNQTRLNVTGNNIANVNTVGFKSSRALFKPQFYVTDSAGSPAEGNFGGTNPSQRGLGALVGSIEKDWSTGSLEPTGKATDLAIDGNGFFVVERGGQEFYTRDGSFNLNRNNELVSGSGGFVQGWMADDAGEVTRGETENIRIPLGAASKAKSTENVVVKGDLDTAGETANGASVLATAEFTTAAATPPVAGSLLTDLRTVPGGAPMYAVGDVITMNVTKGGRDLGPQTFEVDATSTLGQLTNMINESAGIATGLNTIGGVAAGARIEPTGGANARVEVLGNLGKGNSLNLSGDRFTVTGVGMSFNDDSVVIAGETFASDPSGESIRTTIPVYDSLGKPLLLDVTMVYESANANGTTWRYFAESGDDTDAVFDPADPDDGRLLQTGTIEFDTNGVPVGNFETNVSLDRTDTGSGDPLSFDLDFSEIRALGKESRLTGAGDGRAAGTLTNFGIGDNGIITGTFSNGLTQTLGEIAVGVFDNPQGLIDEGGNLFRTGANSGDPQIGGPQEGLAGGIRSGTLELSNVDLSGEFINMIISSTGFSAASRVISTSDRLLTELIQSAR